MYIPTGDGTCCGDPFETAQDPLELRGKVLRIDVRGGLPYAIPPDNPYAGSVDTLPEIWAFGLRNPYRSSFDRQTGELYIADVGQDTWEEVNVQSPGQSAINYGWPTMEGYQCYNPSFGCDTSGLRRPILDYQHIDFNCSITGGFVYRGCGIPELIGRYFFGDFCSGRIWSATHDGSSATSLINHEAEIGVPFGSLFGFGEDGKGELYLCVGFGELYRIKAAGVPLEICDCCVGVTGNVDAGLSGQVDIADLTFLIDHLFISNPPLPCTGEGNVDALGPVDIADITFLIDHLFVSNVPLPTCP